MKESDARRVDKQSIQFIQVHLDNIKGMIIRIEDKYKMSEVNKYSGKNTRNEQSRTIYIHHKEGVLRESKERERGERIYLISIICLRKVNKEK